ncbi:MAG: hypothetical protein M3394_01455 [Actinomycetota bacterium]|nr:hypothetical protein [Actinomycetota bacterium]
MKIRVPVLPPAEAAPPTVRKLMDELARLTAEQDKAHREVNRLKTVELPRAKQHEQETMAKAIRAGKPAAPPGDVARTEASITEQSRVLDALDTAVDECRRELLDAIEAARPEWLADVEKRVAAGRTEVLAAIEHLGHVQEGLAHDYAIRAWLRSDGAGFKPVTLQVPDLRHRQSSTDATNWPLVIEGLRSAVAALDRPRDRRDLRHLTPQVPLKELSA